jgi:DNA-binding MurR/RpiR family transcriptional regulator|tara:strand:+ start:4712 stop:5200 length:489 start_codon:yes stop_codon:yes gene_type:complete
VSNFDIVWNSYPELYNLANEGKILAKIETARRIVFVAKGRVSLVTKMFMQRLCQRGHLAYHSEDLQVPNLDYRDLVIFVTASGNTASSYAYIDIAKQTGASTMAITFSPHGRISKAVDNCITYTQGTTSSLMKSYHEIGFLYIFERLISAIPMDQFVHTNLE